MSGKKEQNRGINDASVLVQETVPDNTDDRESSLKQRMEKEQPQDIYRQKAAAVLLSACLKEMEERSESLLPSFHRSDTSSQAFRQFFQYLAIWFRSLKDRQSHQPSADHNMIPAHGSNDEIGTLLRKSFLESFRLFFLEFIISMELLADWLFHKGKNGGNWLVIRIRHLMDTLKERHFWNSLRKDILWRETVQKTRHVMESNKEKLAERKNLKKDPSSMDETFSVMKMQEGDSNKPAAFIHYPHDLDTRIPGERPERNDSLSDWSSFEAESERDSYRTFAYQPISKDPVQNQESFDELHSQDPLQMMRNVKEDPAVMIDPELESMQREKEWLSMQYERMMTMESAEKAARLRQKLLEQELMMRAQERDAMQKEMELLQSSSRKADLLRSKMMQKELQMREMERVSMAKEREWLTASFAHAEEVRQKVRAKDLYEMAMEHASMQKEYKWLLASFAHAEEVRQKVREKDLHEMVMERASMEREYEWLKFSSAAAEQTREKVALMIQDEMEAELASMIKERSILEQLTYLSLNRREQLAAKEMEKLRDEQELQMREQGLPAASYGQNDTPEEESEWQRILREETARIDSERIQSLNELYEYGDSYQKEDHTEEVHTESEDLSRNSFIEQPSVLLQNEQNSQEENLSSADHQKTEHLNFSMAQEQIQKEHADLYESDVKSAEEIDQSSNKEVSEHPSVFDTVHLDLNELAEPAIPSVSASLSVFLPEITIPAVPTAEHNDNTAFENIEAEEPKAEQETIDLLNPSVSGPEAEVEEAYPESSAVFENIEAEDNHRDPETVELLNPSVSGPEGKAEEAYPESSAVFENIEAEDNHRDPETVELLNPSVSGPEAESEEAYPESSAAFENIEAEAYQEKPEYRSGSEDKDADRNEIKQESERIRQRTPALAESVYYPSISAAPTLPPDAENPDLPIETEETEQKGEASEESEQITVRPPASRIPAVLMIDSDEESVPEAAGIILLKNAVLAILYAGVMYCSAVMHAESAVKLSFLSILKVTAGITMVPAAVLCLFLIVAGLRKSEEGESVALITKWSSYALFTGILQIPCIAFFLIDSGKALALISAVSALSLVAVMWLIHLYCPKKRKAKVLSILLAALMIVTVCGMIVLMRGELRILSQLLP